MEAKICDRCGEICGDERYEIIVGKHTKEKKWLFSGEKIKFDFCDYDLCIKCASEFEKWLEWEENNNASSLG